MAATRILLIVGKKQAGKTTMMIALAGEYARKGRRVMAIKHAAQAPEVDREGSDSFRLFHEGKAQRVLIASPGLRVVFDRTPDDTDPLALARRYLDGADIVLVEGFSSQPLPKIEVFRRESSATPLYEPGSTAAEEWIAIVTNDEHFEAPVPVLRFRDTMWLQLLANIGWDRAKIL